MADEKKKPEEETTPQGEQKAEQSDSGTKPAESPKEETKTEGEEKLTEETQSEENGKSEKAEENTENATEDKPPEETAEEPEAAPPELSEIDKVKEENFRLKTQLEAMKIGFNPNVIEDAVVLAENIVKRDGSDIATALKAVAKKYPEWKADGEGKKGGIKVGADTSKQTNANSDKLNKAFGIKK